MEQKALDYRSFDLKLNTSKNIFDFIYNKDNFDPKTAYLSNNNLVYIRNFDFQVNAKMTNYFNGSESEDVHKAIETVEKDIAKIENILPLITELMKKGNIILTNNLHVEKGELYKVYDFRHEHTRNHKKIKQEFRFFDILDEDGFNMYSKHECLKEATVNLLGYYDRLNIFNELEITTHRDLSITPRKTD